MIPDWQTLLRPLLDELSDGSTRRVRDLIVAMSDQFQLGDEDRAALLPSGRQRRMDNRVNWSVSHLFRGCPGSRRS